LLAAFVDHPISRPYWRLGVLNWFDKILLAAKDTQTKTKRPRKNEKKQTQQNVVGDGTADSQHPARNTTESKLIPSRP